MNDVSSTGTLDEKLREIANRYCTDDTEMSRLELVEAAVREAAALGERHALEAAAPLIRSAPHSASCAWLNRTGVCDCVRSLLRQRREEPKR